MASYEIFIGIDVSKKTLDVFVFNQKEDTETALVVENNEKGFKDLQKMLKGLKKEQLLFCLEHTGIYALPVCEYLESKDYAYVLENPLQIKRSLGMVRGKTDAADARQIARYVKLFHSELKLTKLPVKVMRQLQLLNAFRNRLVKVKTILETSSKELKEVLDDQVVRQITKESLKAVQTVKQQVKLAEKKLEELIKSDQTMNENYKLTCSVIGVGPQTAQHILVATQNFTAFDCPRKFACYVGVAPFEHSSGTSIRGKTRVSHMANKKIKSLLYNAANSAIQHDPQLRRYYERKMEEGKPYLSVINAVKSKLIARVFAVIKNQRPYVKLSY